MSKKMNNIDTDDLVFQEEVNEDELYSKKNTSDIIYKEEDNGKSKFLVLLAIILILVSILSAIMGFVFWDKDLKKENGNVAVTKYNLFIIHSNDLYGGSINSFSNYDSLSNAFSYKFVVSNSNPVTLDYSVELVNSNHDKDNVDMTLINYRLLKNGKIVNKGILSNLVTNKLYNTDILDNSSDEYIIQMWSSEINKNVKFDFSINVSV